MSRRSRWWLPLALLLGLGGCATVDHTATVRAPAEPVELTEVPFYPQERYQCGPAAMAMMLSASGLSVAPETLTEKLYIPARQGTLQPELLAQAREADRLAYPVDPDFNAILAELAAGRPVLVLQNLGLSWFQQWHYAVVVGYLPEQHQVVLRSGTLERRLTPLDTFMRTWSRGDRWAIVTLAPGELPASGKPAHYLKAAFEFERNRSQASANAAYRAGIRRWPEYAPLYLALANARYAAGALEEAEAILAAAITRGVDDPTLDNNHAMLLSALGRHEDAEAAARRAVASGGGEARYLATLEEVRAARAASHARNSETLLDN